VLSSGGNFMPHNDASGSYTFLLEEAGEDQYGHDLKNGAEQLRG
jgi:hypothetical protein